MKFDNPKEWFRKRFCSHCKTQECKTKGAGIYATSGREDLLPCILALVLMSLTERNEVRNYRKVN